MSLDVYLTIDESVKRHGSGIYIRESGSTREVTMDEWSERFPGKEPIVSSYSYQSNTVFSRNITHNLGAMAREAGIYKHLWRPDEIGIDTAAELIEPLQMGLDRLKSNYLHYAEFNPSNGWGDYDGLVSFVSSYLTACKKYPQAKVSASR